jgi:hypothetical protein
VELNSAVWFEVEGGMDTLRKIEQYMSSMPEQESGTVGLGRDCANVKEILKSAKPSKTSRFDTVERAQSHRKIPSCGWVIEDYRCITLDGT